MLRRLAGMALLMVLWTSGCASHYVRQDGGRADFYLHCPQAHDVALATSLDDFVPRRARRNSHDLWVVTVPAGHDFSYFYLVDGKVFKPDCRMTEQDDFGGINCVFSVAP